MISFNYILKIILNVWHRMWSARSFKFFILRWNWYFEFIVFVWIFYLFPYILHAKIEKARYLSFLCKLTLSAISSVSLWASDVLLILEIINMIYILHVRLLYTFLVISFVKYKECNIWGNSFNKFSNVVTRSTYANTVVNLWRFA